MKFIYIQDIHIQGKNSRSRKGDYYSDIMTKLNEVFEVAKKLNIKTIISGGDTFNSPIVSYKIIDDFADKLEHNEISWHEVEGNHTEIGNNPETSQTNVTNHLIKRCEKFNHLDKIEIDKFLIKGYDYYHGIEKDIKERGLMTDSKSEWKIAVIHAFITANKFLDKVLHAQIKDIETNYDVVLVAHNHQGFGAKRVGKTKFINIGCFGRTSINEKDIRPSLLIIDTESHIIDRYVLKSAKAGDEVFNVEEYNELKASEEDLEQLIASLKDARFQGINLRDIIEKVCEEREIGDDIRQDIINKISNHERESDE